MIIAVDQSLSETGVAVVLKDGRIIVTSVKTTPDMPWLHRMELITNEILQFFNPVFMSERYSSDEPCEAFVMESYAYGGSTKGFVLGELGGVIKWSILSKYRDLPFFAVVPAHHKMFVARAGHATKDDTMDGLRLRYKLDISNDNIADAASMALLVHTAWLYKAGQITVEAYDKNLFESAGLLDGRKDLRQVQPRSKKSGAKQIKRTCNVGSKKSNTNNNRNTSGKFKKLKITAGDGLGDLFDLRCVGESDQPCIGSCVDGWNIGVTEPTRG